MKQKLPNEIIKIIFKINNKVYLLKIFIKRHPYRIRDIQNPSNFIQKCAVTQD
jgi:hypothetical protein